MTAETLPRVEFDPRMTYAVYQYLPGNIAGFDRQGNAMDAQGKKLPVRAPVTVVLQQGQVFTGTPGGGQVSPWEGPLPQEVREWIEAQEAYPGVTHLARVLKCPVPNCTFRTTRQQCYADHKRLHRDLTPQEWANLEGGGRKGQARGKFSPADFMAQDASKLFKEQTEGVQEMPNRPSAQGEG